jgi:hypothetical protein
VSAAITDNGLYASVPRSLRAATQKYGPAKARQKTPCGTDKRNAMVPVAAEMQSHGGAIEFANVFVRELE